ncbi:MULTISPECIES: hypothetical protein [unclassified Iodidimonas]|jgi:hypothetical protein|uniref:hypothetical protein n=1 Tax=unclassified Iodidimonas TaxID=2626145 RepID=UPI002482181F|nr:MULTISPECIES: hypothetical protein [unclassified Iodidimonas]
MRNDHLDHENRPRKIGVLSDDLRVIQQRRIEEAAERQAHADANLRRAVRLGEAMRALKDEC